MMKTNKIENIHRIYADFNGVPVKIEADREKQVVSVEYRWTGDDNARRCFEAFACVNGEPDRFCMSEYANSDSDSDWNIEVTCSAIGSLNTDKDILELVESLLTNFFEAEQAMSVYRKLKESGLVK